MSGETWTSLDGLAEAILLGLAEIDPGSQGGYGSNIRQLFYSLWQFQLSGQRTEWRGQWLTVDARRRIKAVLADWLAARAQVMVDAGQ